LVEPPVLDEEDPLPVEPELPPVFPPDDEEPELEPDPEDEDPDPEDEDPDPEDEDPEPEEEPPPPFPPPPPPPFLFHRSDMSANKLVSRASTAAASSRSRTCTSLIGCGAANEGVEEKSSSATVKISDLIALDFVCCVPETKLLTQSSKIAKDD